MQRRFHSGYMAVTNMCLPMAVDKRMLNRCTVHEGGLDSSFRSRSCRIRAFSEPRLQGRIEAQLQE
jgi:hypothetical protein